MTANLLVKMQETLWKRRGVCKEGLPQCSWKCLDTLAACLSRLARYPHWKAALWIKPVARDPHTFA